VRRNFDWRIIGAQTYEKIKIVHSTRGARRGEVPGDGRWWHQGLDLGGARYSLSSNWCTSTNKRGKEFAMTSKNKVKNSAQIVKGKVKSTAGSATGNGQLEVEGEADQMKGNLKQAGEKVKDAFKK
jgi:uncharacterized protein YjbJ (UPF0337 family)